MRTIHALATLAVFGTLAVPSATAGAQDVRILAPGDRFRSFMVDDDRPMIGVTTATESERADTLGLRITEVTKDSPADKAGLKAGDRLQAVNGLNLRANAADAGLDDYAGVLTRRLQREIQKTDAGESVELRVLSGSSARTVRVTPAKASDVVRMPEAFEREWRSFSGDRAVLGLQVSSTGSVRDTLGIFVTSVSRGGPAEKAGIIEGDRIAAINGVSLKVAREDAEDRAVGQSRLERLTREVEKLDAGQSAELTVVTAGRSRTVRVTAAKASDLPQEDGVRIFSIPGGERRVRPNSPDGGTFQFRSPDGEGTTYRFRSSPDGGTRMQLRELAPRLDELRRRLETESAASGRNSRRVII
jgi:predicted metalloprotease with PDZ domain